MENLKLYPSDGATWMECRAMPGFLASNRDKVPEDTSNAASREGHEAHELGAGCLITGDFDPEIFPTPEMAENVEGYIRFVEDMSPEGSVVMVEQRLTPFYYQNEEGNSYLDCIIIIDGGRIIRIVDYKNGVWSVQAEENKQLTIYGKTAIDRLPPELLPNLTGRSKIELYIYQPKPMGERPVREWKLSKAQLEKAAKPIGKVAASIIKDPLNQPFAPSPDNCHFCDAADFCKARASFILSEFAEDPEDLLDRTQAADIPEDPKVLTNAELIRIYEIGPALKKLVDGAKAQLTKRDIDDPGTVDGLKAVAGHGTRVWDDPEEAEEFLEEYLDPTDLYSDPEFLSPAQAEKKLSALRMGRKGRPVFDRLETLCNQPPGGPTLVSDDDPRPRYGEGDAVATEFDNLDEVAN
jgi:hypothetical protein